MLVSISPLRSLWAALLLVAFGLPCLLLDDSPSAAQETLRHPLPLHDQLRQVPKDELARETRLRGNPQRGALVFHKSAAACVLCHVSGEGPSPLGPNLASLDRETDEADVVEALLEPSKRLAKGYETVIVATDSGEVVSGMLVEETTDEVVLRQADDLTATRRIAQDTIEALEASSQSMMPDGLMSALDNPGQFYDLVAYVTAVARGGPSAAADLRPSAEALAVTDDSANLDHAGIIKRLGRRDLQAGENIYHGYCVECHGADGNRPSLPTARAFGTQKLRFGADPYAMFMTLTRGNGLMAPMSHLTPKERYQVVHYIRETFMRSSNPDYKAADEAYLAGLPKGTELGDEVPVSPRDFGPALASQLRRDFTSVLSIDLNGKTIAYNTHTMDQADIWQGEFVEYSQTQHNRDRGEGTVNPAGKRLEGLAGWRWAHDGQVDYPRAGLLPRGPLPKAWMEYQGYYLHGDRVVLSYHIDGRAVLEMPSPAGSGKDAAGVRHSLRIGGGAALRLVVAQRSEAADAAFIDPPLGAASAAGGSSVSSSSHQTGRRSASASGTVAILGDRTDGDWQSATAAIVRGDTAGLRWQTDAKGRLILHLPADEADRRIEIERVAVSGAAAASRELERLSAASSEAPAHDPEAFVQGGPARWTEPVQSTGYLGLERGAYALDTLTLPTETPWNTWFRTAALDFFSDGRMAVSTYGGDIWIVSGIDDSLQQLTWKRFAAGLYEPLGLKIVDDQVYVTCKDRVARLHDFNGDGEADYYENFSADDDVSIHFHAFNFDLQHDRQGNFYYAKAGHGADYALPGAIIQISPDGRHRNVYCTGFRSPNGMGILPDGRLTVSDNQGQWTPASKINLVRPGGFYGWVPTYALAGKWAPDGGRLDLDKVVPPKTHDPPLVYMPQWFDNSSGGQLWAGDERWGPLAGHLLHTSFGKGWMSYALMQQVDGQDQAAIIKLPFDWRSGIMRARVNPADGQVYAVGLQGWNGGGRPGLRDGGIQRLRYTGQPQWMVVDAKVAAGELRLRFTQPIDPASAQADEAFQIEHWNYLWQASYGSKQYRPSSGEVGVDTLEVSAVHVDDDGRGVRLSVPDLQAVDQLHLVMRFVGADGQPLLEELYWTIHALPSADEATAVAP